MNRRLTEVMLKPNENVELVGSTADELKLIFHEHKLTKLQIVLSNGAVLYVPLPESMCHDRKILVDTSASYVF